MVNAIRKYMIHALAFSAWCLFLVSLSLLGSHFAHADSAKQQYSFGVVPQFNVREIERIWRPLLQQVHALSGVDIKLVPSPDIPTFEKQFSSGKFDFAYMNPYHAIVANRSVGYVPILRDVSKKLKGIIVVKKTSEYTDVKQLDGKKVVMPAPNALGAALLPRAEFAKIYAIKPDISYVKSHDSVYLNVAMGLAQAGGGVMATLKRTPAKVRDKLRVLYSTQSVAAHPIVASSKVDSATVASVKQAFLKLGESPAGRDLLKRIPIKKIGSADLNDYKPLMNLGLDDFYVK